MPAILGNIAIFTLKPNSLCRRGVQPRLLCGGRAAVGGVSQRGVAAAGGGGGLPRLHHHHLQQPGPGRHQQQQQQRQQQGLLWRPADSGQGRRCGSLQHTDAAGRDQHHGEIANVLFCKYCTSTRYIFQKFTGPETYLYILCYTLQIFSKSQQSSNH